MSDSLWPHGLYSPWNSPGQNTGVGSLSFLQVIFPTQGWNPGLPHYRRIFDQLSHQGSSLYIQVPAWSLFHKDTEQFKLCPLWFTTPLPEVATILTFLERKKSGVNFIRITLVQSHLLFWLLIPWFFLFFWTTCKPNHYYVFFKCSISFTQHCDYEIQLCS